MLSRSDKEALESVQTPVDAWVDEESSVGGEAPFYDDTDDMAIGEGDEVVGDFYTTLRSLKYRSVLPSARSDSCLCTTGGRTHEIVRTGFIELV